MTANIDAPTSELVAYLERYQGRGLPPILWVGAGASAAAGYPTLSQLEDLLRKDLRGVDVSGPELVDVYIKTYSRNDLGLFLQRHLAKPLPHAPIHVAIARLAAAGVLPQLFTTNYDRLLENALTALGTRFVPQVLEANFQLQALDEVQVLKLHGGAGDWWEVVLSQASYASFERDHPLLVRQLDLSLRTHPVLFVGCSMTDERLTGWLEGLSADEREALFASRVLITHKDWGRIPEETRSLLDACNIRPILVESHDDITRLMQRAAAELAPLDPGDLVFDVEPLADGWRVVGPTGEAEVFEVDSPLDDPAFIELLERLRKWTGVHVNQADPRAKALSATMDALARQIGARLSDALLSDQARQAVQRRINQSNRGRARLTIRTAPPDAAAAKDDEGKRPIVPGDRVLALPWELLMPEPGTFAVREGQLDVVREAVMDGAPVLDPPTEPLSVAATVAAPEDQVALNYESESFRLLAALSSLGHQVDFSNLGGVDDFVEVADTQQATVLHFSGHGLPGELLFENEYGRGVRVEIQELVRKLRLRLQPAGRPGTFPRLFFLASCHGATATEAPPPWPPEDPDDTEAASRSPLGERQSHGMDAALGTGPSTAATLHRSGFVQVIGYFGPIGDELCTRAEEAFYDALAKGESTLQAAAIARETLSAPLAVGESAVVYPLGWLQLAVYHRGDDLPLALPGEARTLDQPSRFKRHEKEVGGLPVLEIGFIGRRSLQHEVRRRYRDGQRLLVLQGLGGLGKTALAGHLLGGTFRTEAPEDLLILRCAGLDELETHPVDMLADQADKHGHAYRLPQWEERMRAVQEAHPQDRVARFAAILDQLRQDRPNLVVYADNVESLQDGPGGDDPEAMGDWKPGLEQWWATLAQLSERGTLVLASTRYLWPDLTSEEWVPVGPMSRADILRMMTTFDSLYALPRTVLTRLAERCDGHPRTVEYLAALVTDQRRALGVSHSVKDPWRELVEPVLPEVEDKLTNDLLLSELWRRLSGEAREHARALAVLRVPAPTEVIDTLGDRRDELVRTSLLTRHRLPAARDGQRVWEDRWGLHGLVKDFVGSQEDEGSLDEAALRRLHVEAGRAYEAWVAKPGARWSDQVEGIEHLFAAREGDLAWPMVNEYVLWLRRKIRYTEAATLLDRCEGAGVSGDNLANALALLVQMRRHLGQRQAGLNDHLVRARAIATDDETRAFVMEEQGRTLHAQGQYGEAEKLLRDSLAIREKTVGTEHPKYGVGLHELASALRAQGRYAEAEQLLRDSLAIDERVHGKKHPSYATSLNELASVLHAQGRYGEAEKLLREVLAILEIAHGKEHPDYAASLHQLARALHAQGRYGEAEQLLRDSLAIKEGTVGKEHPSYAASLHQLSAALHAQGRYGEAEKLLHESLAILENVHGKEHPDYATSLHELSGALQAQGRYGEAEQLLRDSLAIKERVHDKEHPTLCTTLTNLGQILARQGTLEEGEQMILRALRIAEAAFATPSPESAQICSHLAQVQAGAGKPEARRTAQRALAELAATLGADHPTTQSFAPTLQAIAAGQSPSTEKSPAEQLRVIVANTIAVLTAMPDKLEEWRETIANRAQRAQAEDDAPLAELLEAILELLAGGEPELAPDHPHHDAWQQIIDGIDSADGESPGVTAEVMETVQAFLTSKDWAATRLVVEEHADALLTDDVDALFERSIEKAKADGEAQMAQSFEAHLAVLRACREHGIDEAFRRFEEARRVAQQAAPTVDEALISRVVDALRGDHELKLALLQGLDALVPGDEGSEAAAFRAAIQKALLGQDLVAAGEGLSGAYADAWATIQDRMG